jgi:hypothetical protein
MTQRWRALLAAMLLCLVSGAAAAQTRSGFEIGPEIYYYAYREPNFIAQIGPYIGVNGSYTHTFGSWFLTGNVIAGVGYLDYSSTGTGSIHGIWNYTGDLRGLAGRDLPLGGWVASPYIGIGYRLLFDEAGGRNSTTGAAGYDRLSQYLYIPFGVRLGIRAGDWVLRPSAEYDLFIHGIQTSYISEVGFDDDPVNRQTHGYGVRAAFLAETRTEWGEIAFGPFFRYWNVGRSQSATLSLGGTPAFTVFEPANNTVEAGATLRWRF